jgi:hypothetical protein
MQISAANRRQRDAQNRLTDSSPRTRNLFHRDFVWPMKNRGFHLCAHRIQNVRSTLARRAPDLGIYSARIAVKRERLEKMLALRTLGVWLLIIALETLHGVARVVFLQGG